MCGGFIMCSFNAFIMYLIFIHFVTKEFYEQTILVGNLIHVFMRCNVAILHNYCICTLNNKMVSDCVLFHVNIKYK